MSNETLTHVILPSRADGSEESVPVSEVRERLLKIRVNQFIDRIYFETWLRHKPVATLRRTYETIRRTS